MSWDAFLDPGVWLLAIFFALVYLVCIWTIFK
jgi:hypothetical protein